MKFSNSVAQTTFSYHVVLDGYPSCLYLDFAFLFASEICINKYLTEIMFILCTLGWRTDEPKCGGDALCLAMTSHWIPA